MYLFKRILTSAAVTALVALTPAQTPAYADGLAGSYLAAGQANYRSDFANAARYYGLAASEAPDNQFLKQNAIINMVLAGDIAAAVPVARDLRALAPEAQLAGLVLVANAFAADDYDAAAEVLEDKELQFNPLLAGLVHGWASVGQGEIGAATTHFDGLAHDTSFGSLGAYHKALMMAYVGNFDGALEIMEDGDGGPLRVNRASLLTHVQMLMQVDRRDDALALIDQDETALTSSDVTELRARIEAGEDVSFDYIRTPRDGASEVFLTLATALNQEEADRFATLYGRLAQHIRPDYIDAHLLVADLLERQDQHKLAIAEYAKVPESSAVFRSAEIGRADAMASAGQVAEAIDVLSGLTKSFPEDRFVHIALGDLLRGEEQYEGAKNAYSSAIALIETPNQFDWRTYYVRGIAFERLDAWENAEADFRKALELSPEQPLVLNYLGYSLVEKRMKIDEAKDMIERAVAARPNDGYITDSLGWVLYRLGDFEGAVPHMERAAELLPTDPIINDHLGDVYWMVGRKVEAEFQWRRALSFEPEEVDAERIRLKLELGLDLVLDREETDKE